MRSISALVTSFSQFFQPMASLLFVQRPMVQEPAASSTPPRGPIIALLRECPASRIAEFADLEETFLARGDCVSEVESSLTKSPQMKRPIKLK